MRALGPVGRNVLANVLGQGVVIALTLVAVHNIHRHLGDDALGIFSLATTLGITLTFVFDLGMGATTVREVAAGLESRPESVFAWCRTAACILATGYAALLAAFVAVCPSVVRVWIGLGRLQPDRAQEALIILMAGALVALPRSVPTSILRGLQRMDIVNGIDVFCIGIQQIGVVLLLRANAGLRDVALWIAGTQAVAYLVSLTLVHCFVPWRGLLPGFSPSALGRNLSYARHCAIFSVLGIIHLQADKIAVSLFLPIGVLGYYGFTYGGVAKVNVLTNGVATAAMPLFSALHAAGDRASLVRRYHQLQDFLCIGLLPILAAVPFATLPVMSAVFDPVIARSLLPAACLLALGFYMNGAVMVPHVLSLAAGRPDINVRLNALAIAIVLPVTMLLVWSEGLTGAGLSWVAYNTWSMCYGVPRFLRECLGAPGSDWARHIAPIVIRGGATYGGAWFAVWTTDHLTWPWLAGAYMGASLIYVFLALRVARPELRAALVQYGVWATGASDDQGPATR